MSKSRFAVLATLLVVLVAGVSLATVEQHKNPYYDESASSGGLHKVCDLFEVTSDNILKAWCNKVTNGVVTKHHASVDLNPDTDSNCTMFDFKLNSDGVTYVYICEIDNAVKMFEKDLAELVKWEASTGELSLVRKEEHRF